LVTQGETSAILVLPIDRLGPVVLGGTFMLDTRVCRFGADEMKIASVVLRAIVLLNRSAFARRYVMQNELSSQDVRIINLIAEGKSNWAIANILDMKELKLKGLVRGLMEKFSLMSRSDIQQWAYVSGIYMLASSTDRGG
jgi:DNA-binding CsgD family transcriptional regulator